MPYSPTELQNAWNRYVVMKKAEWISVSSPSSAAYEAGFVAMMQVIFANQMFGFDPAQGGSRVFGGYFGSSPIVSGPTKS